MRLILFVIPTLLLFTFSGCQDSYGNQIQGGDLTVHFLERENQQVAEQIALFFKERDLITNHKQDVQLVKGETSLELNVIADNPNEAKEMSFDEIALLMEFQKDLSRYLDQRIEVVICNKQFKPVYRLN